jgi:small subunit ribosomal protein S9
MEVINTSGRRKTAVARVYLKPGNGTITVNKRDYKDYFLLVFCNILLFSRLLLTGNEGQIRRTVNLDGGGITGQAQALRLAISKALVEINAEWRRVLKERGLMRRDPRMVERKKPGQKKARKRFQFSKR